MADILRADNADAETLALWHELWKRYSDGGGEALQASVDTLIEQPLLSGVERPVLSGVEGPPVRDAKRPVLSGVEGPVMSDAEGRATSEGEGSALSSSATPGDWERDA